MERGMFEPGDVDYTDEENEGWLSSATSGVSSFAGKFAFWNTPTEYLLEEYTYETRECSTSDKGRLLDALITKAREVLWFPEKEPTTSSSFCQMSLFSNARTEDFSIQGSDEEVSCHHQLKTDPFLAKAPIEN